MNGFVEHEEPQGTSPITILCSLKGIHQQCYETLGYMKHQATDTSQLKVSYTSLSAPRTLHQEP